MRQGLRGLINSVLYSPLMVSASALFRSGIAPTAPSELGDLEFYAVWHPRLDDNPSHRWLRDNEPKTQSSRRTLPLDEGMISVFKRASARYAQEKLALGAAHADSGYVAVNEAGEPYTPGALTNMWDHLATAAGVHPIRLHDARHSCGTALHLRGVPMAVIAKWLGHADASIAGRIYAHSQDDALRATSATLRQVVTPALSTRVR